MSTKHAVRTSKHKKHLVTAKAHHTAHPTHTSTHTAHPVHPRTQDAGVIRPFESLGSVVEDLLSFPMAEENMLNMAPVDIRETDRTVEVSVALSGIQKKDINLDLTEDSLTISGERCEGREEKGKAGYRLKEQSYGTFYRSFLLPAAVRSNDARATYKDGLLRVTMQKTKPNRIMIE
ncbi:MAG: Hsp20/alpha crystallin family protein [Elusimicrobia bacterium]|nr:Hsp20/alpha crystallin family protein [Elusimicrobiota bacterium]